MLEMVLWKQMLLIRQDEEKMCGSLVKHPIETKYLGLGLLVPLQRQVANDCFGHYPGLLTREVYVNTQAEAWIFPVV